MVNRISKAVDSNANARSLGVKVKFEDEFSLSNEIGNAVILPGVYYDVIIADSPVGYWRLGELVGTTVVDEIVPNNGIYINSPTLGEPGAIAGDSNTSVYFDETLSNRAQDIGISSTFSFIQNTGIFAIECWAKINNLAGGNLVLFGNTVGGTGVKGFTLFFVDATNSLQFSISKGVAPLTVSITTPTNTINDVINFHHIVVTGDGSDVYVYVDGLQVATSAIGTLSTGDSSRSLYFGVGPNVSGNPVLYLDGTLDEIAIYDSYLTLTKVLEHYNAGIL